jgi:hypothetical protein
MIHSNQSEYFMMTVYNGIINPAGAANSAIRNKYRLATDGILHLVMKAEQADRVGF